MASVEEVAVPGPAGDLAARVYRPEESGPVPTVVLFHGGGWVVGDLDTHDNAARSICRDARAVVVSVDYRLAPEAPFPAAVDDAVAATAWVAAHLADLGGDDRLAVAGDSAGGNLAAVVAQHARDTGGPAIAAQLLVYPAVDVLGEYPSRAENGTGYFLDLPTMAWFMGHYAGGARPPRRPAAVPAARPGPRRAAARGRGHRGVRPAARRGRGVRRARCVTPGVPVDVRAVRRDDPRVLRHGAVLPGAQKAVDETCERFAALLRGLRRRAAVGVGGATGSRTATRPSASSSWSRASARLRPVSASICLSR